MKLLIEILVFLFLTESSFGESEEPDTTEDGQFPGSKKTTCPCGFTNKGMARIVGGSETGVNEFPFMLGLIDRSEMFVFCGAALVTPNHGLTAAHCTRGRSNLAVYVGEHDLFSTSETNVTEIIDVNNIIEHPDYETKNQRNDLAVLVLSKPADFSSKLIGPACLPSENQDLVGKYVRILGWGHMRYRGAMRHSKVLRKVNLRVVPLTNCADTFPVGAVSVDKPTQICTFSYQRDACKGDSGGPVLWLDPETNMYTLVGVVSYGAECGKDSPAIQTNIGSYISWIRQTIEGSSSATQICTKE